MNEENYQEEGLSLKDIFSIFKLHWISMVIITIVGLICGVGFGMITPPKYQASMSVYINNSSDSTDTGSTSGDTKIDNELVNSLRLINTFKAFITESAVSKNATDKLKDNEVLKAKGLEITDNFYKTIISGLSASTTGDNTLCVVVSYTHTDATVAKIVIENVILSANEVARSGELKIFKDRINTVYQFEQLGNGNCADVRRTSKGIPMYAAIGLVGGLVVAIAYVLFRDLADSTLRDKSFVEKKYNVKVIGTIPEFMEENK